VVCIQEESGELEKQLAAERGRSRLVQQDLAASLQESKEALHREQDIMAQLEAQDQVPKPPPSTPPSRMPPLPSILPASTSCPLSHAASADKILLCSMLQQA